MYDYNQYFIHREPTRTQVAEHYHSTLEQPNLENVESMLAATRQKNYELGAKYFRQKFGNSRGYEHMMEQMGLEPLDQHNQQEKTIHDFRNTQEYGDYVREMLEKKKNEIVEAVIKEQNDKKVVKPTVTYNPWTDNKSKAPPKPVEKEVAEQQYLNKFEKFRQNKQRRHSPEEKKANESVKQTAEKPKRNYKAQLITKIYREIDSTGKGFIDKMQLLEYLTDNKKIIAIFNIDQEKLAEDLYSFGTAHEDTLTFNELLKYFGEQPMQLNLIHNHKQSSHQQQPSSKANQQSRLMKNCCLLSPDDVKLFERLFNELDTHSDMLIKRKSYIAHLLENIEIRKLLYKPAMFEPRVNRTILLYRMLDKIQEDEMIGTSQERKVKEYISFKQFMTYFERPKTKSNDSSTDYFEQVKLVKFIETINYKTKSNAIQLAADVLEVFEKMVKAIPHTSETYFKTLMLIDKIKSCEEYDMIRNEIARRDGESDGLQTESIEEVLNRILKEGNEFMELDEFLMFFSRRGRPLEFYRERDQAKKKLHQSIKGSKILAQEYNYLKRDDNEQVLAYDSDPEVYNESFVKRESIKQDNFRTSKLYDSALKKNKSNKAIAGQNQNQNHTPIKDVRESSAKHGMQSRKGLTSNPQFKGTFVSVMVDEDAPRQTMKSMNQMPRNPRSLSATNQFRVTVPQPFSFNARQQHKKVDKVPVTSQTPKPTSIKAKQIPKAVLQVGLFDKIMSENERRRQQTKKNSMMITLATQKPFSFQNREQQKARKKTQQQREQFAFKAKPVPWFCSVDLLKKQNQEDLIKRKQKVSRMAQQSLALSKLPPRMQKNELQKKAEKLREGGDYAKIEEETKHRKAKKPPNFEKLQKALEQQLERKKMNKRPTEFVQFNFQERRKAKSPDALYEIAAETAKAEEPKIDPMEAARRIIEKQPKVRAASTRKFDQQVEKRRKEIEQRKEKQRIMNKHQPPQFAPDIKPKLLSTGCIVNGKDNTISEREKKVREQKKQEEQVAKKKFDVWRGGIMERAKAQPLLVDRPLKRDEHLDRMKKLALISATLDQNGVKGKEKDALFTKQQRNLLKDYQFLKKNNQI